ncbi:hypothetical protein MRX96_042909 [Rhipicephalus microplus]
MSSCMQVANPEVKYDCDVYLYIRPLPLSERYGSAPEALSPSPSRILSSSAKKDTPIPDLDFVKHWQAVFVFKGSPSPTEGNGVVMLEAGKSRGYLKGAGFVTSQELLEIENPRKVFLRSIRISLKMLMNTLTTMNGSRSPYCVVWNNCQEWIVRLMRRVGVVVARPRFSKVVNVLIAVASVGLFAYVIYLSYWVASSRQWGQRANQPWVPPSTSNFLSISFCLLYGEIIRNLPTLDVTRYALSVVWRPP